MRNLRAFTFLSTLLLAACSSSTQGSDASNNDVVLTDSADTTPTTDVPSMDTPPPMDVVTPDTFTDDVPPNVDTPTPTDTLPPSDTMPPSDAGPTACNSLALTGTPITPDCPTGTAPVGTGGTLVPGTYDLTAVHLYNVGPACSTLMGMTVAATLQFSSSTVDVVSQPSGMPVSHASAMWSTSGTSLTITPTCPPGGMASNSQYTATPTSITLIITNSGITAEETFAVH